MNILHHKSWHVRNKDNIAKVRKDEAEALEKEIQKQKRHEQYRSEYKFNALRANKGSIVVKKDESDIIAKDHLNFFETYEKGEQVESFVNEEKEAEKKKEMQDWEKKVGILSYLGQSAVDSQKYTPWYMKVKENPEKLKEKDYMRESQEMENVFAAAKIKKMEEERLRERLAIENAQREATISKEPDKKRRKQHKNDNSPVIKKSASSSIEKLREERLKREAEERVKAEKFLKAHAMAHITSSNKVSHDLQNNENYEWVEKDVSLNSSSNNHNNNSKQRYTKHKYNSQFNPHLL